MKLEQRNIHLDQLKEKKTVLLDVILPDEGEEAFAKVFHNGIWIAVRKTLQYSDRWWKRIPPDVCDSKIYCEKGLALVKKWHRAAYLYEMHPIEGKHRNLEAAYVQVSNHLELCEKN